MGTKRWRTGNYLTAGLRQGGDSGNNGGSSHNGSSSTNKPTKKVRHVEVRVIKSDGSQRTWTMTRAEAEQKIKEVSENGFATKFGIKEIKIL